MDNKEEQFLESDFYVVSDAGSTEVNGVYKNHDGNSNDDTLNYKMTNAEGRTFKLYRSPSEDQSVRYWIIEERNKDYYYLAFSNDDKPPEEDWRPYIAGQGRPPYVTKVPRRVENEIRTRLEHKDSFSTLDLISQYGEHCATKSLRRLYRVVWDEQSPETKKATEVAKVAKSKRKKKKKTTSIKPKITIKVQLGVGSDTQDAQTFDLMITFDAAVRLLIGSIAKQVTKESGKNLEIMFMGHKILSGEAPINSLGITKGSCVIALGVQTELPEKKPASSNAGVRKPALPPLDEADDQPKDQTSSAVVPSNEQIQEPSRRCAIL